MARDSDLSLHWTSVLQCESLSFASSLQALGQRRSNRFIDHDTIICCQVREPVQLKGWWQINMKRGWNIVGHEKSGESRRKSLASDISSITNLKRSHPRLALYFCNKHPSTALLEHRFLSTERKNAVCNLTSNATALTRHRTVAH
jgi:hypothetical protein